jgi:hypothetical protein
MGSRRRVCYNVVKCCSDAFVAKVTKDRPKVSFVTEGGDWQLQQKARAMEKFIEGQFYETDIYEMAPSVVLDGGGIFGTGVFKLYIDGEGKDARIGVDRVLPLELLVDDQEGAKGKPPTMMQEAWIDRPRLKEEYADDPALVEKIEKATRAADANIGHHGGVGYDSTADQLLVTEAWHLPSSRKAKDGRHVIAIENATLLDEPWEHQWFPFVCYRKQRAPLGFWGIGLADELDPIQTSINEKLLRIDKALRLLGAGHVLCHTGSKVNFAQWDNDIGSKIEYTGIKPEIYVPAEVVPQQMFAQLDRDYNRAFEITGIPQAQAQGQVPANLESGKAQEVYLDITDQRMQVAIHNYHHMFLELAKVILELGREIVAKHNKDFGSKCASKRGGMQRILLRENDLDDEACVMKLWPTNGLSDEPAARMKDVERMANAGWLAPDEAKRLLDFPDLEAANDLENASYNAVESCISEMLDKGRYRQPQPFLNLAQATRQVQLALIKAWTDGRPEARLQLLRDWLTDAMQLTQGPGGPQPVNTMASAPGTPVAEAAARGVTPSVGAQIPGATLTPQAAAPGMAA